MGSTKIKREIIQLRKFAAMEEGFLVTSAQTRSAQVRSAQLQTRSAQNSYQIGPKIVGPMWQELGPIWLTVVYLYRSAQKCYRNMCSESNGNSAFCYSQYIDSLYKIAILIKLLNFSDRIRQYIPKYRLFQNFIYYIAIPCGQQNKLTLETKVL